MLKIKLARFGKKKQPMYRIVVNEAKSKRDGQYVAQVGRYSPTETPKILEIDVKEYDGKSIDIEVLSISGKLIYKSKLLSQSNKIDLGAISTGVYLLRIKKDNHWFGRNIIIQKWLLRKNNMN